MFPNQLVAFKVEHMVSTNTIIRWHQNYVIKFGSDLQQVCGFLRVFRFPLLIKLTAVITEILLKAALNTNTLTGGHSFTLLCVLNAMFPNQLVAFKVEHMVSTNTIIRWHVFSLKLCWHPPVRVLVFNAAFNNISTCNCYIQWSILRFVHAS
jgi:hypothetical protein